jgi:hypothetical protein
MTLERAKNGTLVYVDLGKEKACQLFICITVPLIL